MRILIVDDEPGLAAGLAQWLVEGGWGNPGIAFTSHGGVQLINQNGKIDVIVPGVHLKPADRLTLRETLLPPQPKMKTVFISGYDLTEHAARMEGCPLLRKPVTGEA